jgi:hypothetical protein
VTNWQAKALKWLTRRHRSTGRDAMLFGYASQITPILALRHICAAIC